MEKQLLRTKQVCELFSVSRRTIDRWSVRGLLRRIKVGHTTYYRLSEIDNLMNGGQRNG